MQRPRAVTLAMACVVAVISAMTYVSAQENPTERGRPRHLVYIATPGDEGTDNQSGIVVLDADKNYSFIKRISYQLPASQMPGPKVAGIAASVPLNMLYVTFDAYMMAFNLSTDQIAWTFKGEKGPVERQTWTFTGGSAPVELPQGAASGCCERPWLLPDGKTLLVGSSYNNWWYFIDGATGESVAKLGTPGAPSAHNLALSPDGKIGILGSMSKPKITAGVAVVDMPSRKVLRYMNFSDVVRPLTINHVASLVYVNVNNLIGFEIGDVETGKMIKRVELPGEAWKGKGYSHGIGMTPDESEIWVADPVNNVWQVWDNPGDGRNPVYNPSKLIKPTERVSHSWISMTNDGKLAFLGDSSVVDVKKHKEIAVLKDEYARPIVHTEKVLYMTFKDGKLLETNNQFAVGDAKAYAAHMAAVRGSGQ